MKKNFPLEKNQIETSVKLDYEHFQKIYDPVYKHVFKAVKNESYIEAFIMSWAFIEQLLLPTLIRHICGRLKFRKIPKLDERTQVSQLINYFYFLSHDQELYENLVKGNKQRIEIVHKLANNGDIDLLKTKSKNATTFTLEKITLPILDRLSGKVTLPVLTLYPQGWNDYRKEVLKRLK